jgi:hypothetical protein
MEKILYSFRETPGFNKAISKLLSDDELAKFQWLLLQHPESGDLIMGSGGIRKVRCSVKGRGKRSGARVIYYFATSEETIFLLDIYAKNEKSDLTSPEIQALKKIVEEWLK